MSIADFSAKERLRFRKLLEVAYSTTFAGEREAALAAAERVAAAHGLSLREAAGLPERERETPKPEPRPRGHAGFRADFGAAGPEAMGRWWAGRAQPNAGSASEAHRMAAEKRRHDQAMAEAIRRGLDADERAAEAARAKRAETRYTRDRSHSRNHGPWRSRPEFVRVLLAETTMSAKDIAAVAGVTIYDVFREKLLMRRAKAA